MSVSQGALKESKAKLLVPKAKGSREAMLITALMAGYSMIYMDKNMISTAIIPIADQFHLTTSQTGLMMSLFFLGYSLMQIPGGWLADKIGYKKVLILSLSLITLFSFTFGFAGSLLVFILIRFMAGVGHAGYPPSCSKGIAENFPVERRTFIQSLILSTNGIGGILAFVIGARLIDLNWHYGYYALGVFFAISLLLVIFFVPNSAPTPKIKEQPKQISFKEVITNRNVLILFIAMFIANVGFYGNMSWLPSFLKTKFDLSISTVGTILAFNAVGGALASLFAGVLLTKYFAGKEKALLLGSCILSSLLFIGIVFFDSLAPSVVCLYLLTFLLTAIFVTIFSWPHKILPEKVIGSSIGIVNTGGTLGGFVAPMTFGVFISMAGGSFNIVFITLAIAIVVCGLITLTVKIEK
ncbi:MFS transporter [Bacillus andreraoultii]|uniref:MFS transporter n=1 Tax=Bacillus andreraoultii TaxID=1499685 RepID=UPI00067F453C|nr:MFS transporter [Bacillus andreraoultii]